MITAEDFLDQEEYYSVSNDFDTRQAMIKFTKLHVKACKKEIAEDYLYYLEGDEGSERLNSDKFKKKVYPLDNIK